MCEFRLDIIRDGQEVKITDYPGEKCKKKKKKKNEGLQKIGICRKIM